MISGDTFQEKTSGFFTFLHLKEKEKSDQIHSSRERIQENKTGKNTANQGLKPSCSVRGS